MITGRTEEVPYTQKEIMARFHEPGHFTISGVITTVDMAHRTRGLSCSNPKSRHSSLEVIRRVFVKLVKEGKLVQTGGRDTRGLKGKVFVISWQHASRLANDWQTIAGNIVREWSLLNKPITTNSVTAVITRHRPDLEVPYAHLDTLIRSKLDILARRGSIL